MKIGPEEMKIVKVGSELPPPILEKLSHFLTENMNIFAWTPIDMSTIDP